ncbi:MAG: BrnT family toxin [Schwartzia sp.]|nr:BrnT family toxin [Schwartzia sp. (in: firmicutes)]
MNTEKNYAEGEILVVKKDIGGILFEWDEEKNELNMRKHGIRFELALRVFYDENRLEEYDESHSEAEDRYISLGYVNGVLVVVHTDRDEAIRIISARPADKKERMKYYEQFD